MKKFLKIIIVFILVLVCSGCIKRDTMEDIDIITTTYPLEYILTKLYGNNSIVNSIYPDGVDTTEYRITKKKYNDLSKKDLFVYNGASNDKKIALTLLNKNKNLLIIDADFGMEVEYGVEELWLNPSNLLMISQNIKNGLIELINSKYIKDEIENKYSELKLELSELDAEIKILYEQSSEKTIITDSPSLQFLSKYGFRTILVNDKTDKKSIDKAISLIKNKKVKYVFTLENEDESNNLKKIKNETKVGTISIDKIDNITDEQRDNKETYVTLMENNLKLLKKGLE